MYKHIRIAANWVDFVINNENFNQLVGVSISVLFVHFKPEYKMPKETKYN